jgi:hypothetical protein
MAVENGFVTRATGTIEAAGFYFNQNIFSSPYYTFLDFVEFISIGENIKAIYGKAPYLFTLGEKYLRYCNLIF